MITPGLATSLDGFDPLAADDTTVGTSVAAVLEEASKRIVYNILKSYTGYFDVFAELLQNALDAVELRKRREVGNYQPKIWITIDIPDSIVRVVDNGVGMSEREFKYCLRPSVSFKKQTELRGHKGVGATFVAYGFSFLKLQSKQSGTALAAILRQGRQWAEDSSGTVPRPKFEAAEFNVSELSSEPSGTCTEIIVGQASGERPKNLGWLGAQNAKQWYTVLSLKSPLGGVYLRTPPFRPKVFIKVRSSEKAETEFETDRAEYFYPHEIPDLKVQSVRDVAKALDGISADPATKFLKLPAEYKRLDCIWDIWDKEEILEENSTFASALDEEHRLLIERHSIIVYACFLRSAKIWGGVERRNLCTAQRAAHRPRRPSDGHRFYGTGRSLHNSAHQHHRLPSELSRCRKVFQPELKEVAEVLAVRAVTTFKRFLQHLKPDSGSQPITPDKELHDWKRLQEAHRDRSPLAFARDGLRLGLVSTPQQEQDVVALFHELVGGGVLRGFRFFGTSQSERYDSLFFMEYASEDSILFQGGSQRLGVSRSYTLPYTTEPKVLEYKYTFDSLVDDFDNEEKFPKQIDLAVCWEAGTGYKAKYFLQPLLVGDEGSSRQIFGATHQAFAAGAQGSPAFEVIILEDLLNWLQDPAGEEARQKRAYRDT
jgi:Histidine kinase-, DNA gyrase B-, and HSP90-like ATPase